MKPADGLEHQVRFERDVHLDGSADVVRVAVRVEVLEEPERFLVLGQRVLPLVAVEFHRARGSVGGVGRGQRGEAVVELGGQLSGRGAAEQGDHGQGDAEFGVDPGP